MKIISVLWLMVLCVGCGGYGSSAKVTPPQPGAVPAIAQLAPNTATAGTKEPSLNGLVFFAMLLIFLIAMALWEIYRHRPY